MSNNIELALILMPILLVSMTIHEMVHAFVGNWLGDDTAKIMGRLSLNPFNHVDPMLTLALPMLMILSGSGALFGAAKPVPVSFHKLKYQEFGGALVGMVGPLTNLLIAGLAGFVYEQLSPAYGSLAYKIFFLTIVMNTWLFVFNSVPWPPLDGSRLLYAFAPNWLQRGMEALESMGLTSIMIIIGFFFVFGNPLSTIVDKLISFIAPTL